MPIPLTTQTALLNAMVQFDAQLRNTSEWAGWEQNNAHLYAIEQDGSRYPVKQIVSMATGTPVSNFSGGKAPGDANAFAAALGFKIVELRPGRNPTWVRDELIVALDLYLRYGGNPPGKGSAEIIGLSDTLNRLARYLGLIRGDRFRNANGVYMKLMNFRRFDPAYTVSGKVGLQRGGKTEEQVWNEFASDPARCQAVAETIRLAITVAPEGETVGDVPEIEEAEEGRVVTALHRRYERAPKIIHVKKKQALAQSGQLACEACGFDFAHRYGERGVGYIECHHTKPVHTLKPEEKTKLADLRLLCANCHRMIHAKRPWLSMEQLIALLRETGALEFGRSLIDGARRSSISASHHLVAPQTVEIGRAEDD